MTKQNSLPLKSAAKTAAYAGLGIAGVCVQSFFGEKTFEQNFVKEGVGLLVAVFLIGRFTDYLAKRRQANELAGIRKQFIEVIVRRTADVAESSFSKFAGLATSAKLLESVWVSVAAEKVKSRVDVVKTKLAIAQAQAEGLTGDFDASVEIVARLKADLAAAIVRAQQRDQDLAKTMFHDDLAKASHAVASALRSIDEITDDVEAIQRYTDVYLAVIPPDWNSGVSRVLEAADFQIRRLRNLRNYLSGTGSMQDRTLALNCDVNLGEITHKLEDFLEEQGLREHLPALNKAHAPADFAKWQRNTIGTMSKVVDELYYSESIEALERAVK